VRNPELHATYKDRDGYVGTAPVGSFPAGDSADGIHDLAGNVSEFAEAVSSAEDTGDLTAGDSFLTQRQTLMTAKAFARTAWSGASSPTVGFRCVRTLEK
jgi:formylglycine-generating enzyme required for sulfatase activity